MMKGLRGFTLIELLVTVTIIALLASVALPMTELIVKRTKEQELHADLREIRKGIDAYKQAWDEGRIPKGLEDNGYPKTLDILAEGVEDPKSPILSKIYFMRRIPRDPFNPDITVSASDSWGKRAYASPPDDPEEGDDVYDVYTLNKGVGLNGIPYREW